MTPQEIQRTIIRALRDEAADLRRQVKLRGNGGPENAGYRASLRTRAARCDDLATAIGQVPAYDLAGPLPAWVLDR